MLQFLFKLVAMVVILLLAYNYFLGNEEEKAGSRKIISEVIQLGKSSWDLLKAEKQKLENGKYDKVLDKVSGLLDGLEKSVDQKGDTSIRERYESLTRERDKLLEAEKALAEKKDKTSADSSEAEAQRLSRLKMLLSETEALMKSLENR